jgi:16S rRNA processing protein RimM
VAAWPRRFAPRPARPGTKKASALASNSSTEPERFVVGRLGRPHGLDGFLGLYIEDEDAGLIQPGAQVFLEDRPHVVRAVRRVDRGHQVAFEGVDDRFAAEEIRGLDLLVEERRELTEDEYWPEDLIGLAVFVEGMGLAGTVKEVLIGPAQDRLLIEREDGSTFQVPFVDDLVPVVDITEGRLELVALPGLTEPED